MFPFEASGAWPHGLSSLPSPQRWSVCIFFAFQASCQIWTGQATADIIVSTLSTPTRWADKNIFQFLYTRCQDRISLNLNWLAPFFHVFFLKFIKFKDNCIPTVADIAAQNKITDVTHHFRKYGFHPFLQAERDLYVVAARNTAKFIAAS